MAFGAGEGPGRRSWCGG